MMKKMLAKNNKPEQVFDSMMLKKQIKQSNSHVNLIKKQKPSVKDWTY